MTTFNPSDCNASITLSGGDLIGTRNSASPAYANVRSTTSKTTGKHYFEAVFSVSVGNAAIGIANSTASLSNFLNSTSDSKGWYETGFGNSYGTTFTTGDTLAIAIDATAGLIWFSKNGTFGGDPVAGTGGTSISGISGGVYFAIICTGANVTQACTINFGGSAFANSPPSGYSAWDAAGGAIAGTSDAAFATAGLLKGTGALAGTSSLTFATSGAMGAPGAMSGASTVAFTTAAILRASGKLSGASSAAFTTTGTLTQPGSISGTSSVTFTTTGTIRGAGRIAGATALTFTATAMPSGGAIWTPVTPSTTIWTPVAPDSSIWTPIT